MGFVSRLFGLRDSSIAMTAMARTQLISRLLGLAVKKTNASPGAVTLASDEILLGPAYKDLLVQLGGSPAGTTQPPTYGRFLQNSAGTMQGVYGWSYSGTAENEQFVDVQMQHDWRVGTTVFPHVHFSPDTAPGSTEVAFWGLEYSKQDIHGGAFPNTSVVYGATLLGTTAKDHRLCPLTSEDGGLSMTGLHISAVLKGRLFRPRSSGTAGQQAVLPWASGTTYVTGNGALVNPSIVYGTSGGRMCFFQCTTAGTSGGTEPVWDTGAIGNTTNDNGIVWTFICRAPATATALYTGALWAHYMDTHYQVDGLGSDAASEKQY